MTPELLASEADWPLEELASFLTDHNITGAPVMEGPRLVGMVSATDLMRNRSGESYSFPDSAEVLARAADAGIAADELHSLRMKRDSALRVRDIMTPVVYDVSENTPASEVAEAMIRGRIHRVVVTRAGKAVGIVSALDLLRVVAELGRA